MSDDDIRAEFGDAVTMTAGELERWLDTDESMQAGRQLRNWGHDPTK